MNENFQLFVEATLGRFLSSKGFFFEEYVKYDSGNMEVLFYVSNKCKLCVYRSHREGEINCMIGDALIRNDLTSNGWSFVNGMNLKKEPMTYEELRARVLRYPRGWQGQLSLLNETLTEHFDEISKKL